MQPVLAAERNDPHVPDSTTSPRLQRDAQARPPLLRTRAELPQLYRWLAAQLPRTAAADPTPVRPKLRVLQGGADHPAEADAQAHPQADPPAPRVAGVCLRIVEEPPPSPTG